MVKVVGGYFYDEDGLRLIIKCDYKRDGYESCGMKALYIYKLMGFKWNDELNSIAGRYPAGVSDSVLEKECERLNGGGR